MARRLEAESIVFVFAARDRATSTHWPGCRSCARRTPEAHARELLASVISGPLDERVGERIVAETRGNPLALLELPHGLSPAELAGGFALTTRRCRCRAGSKQSFRRRVERLPADSQRLLLVAAAEPIGDPALLWRAAERLGISGRRRPSLSKPPAC